MARTPRSTAKRKTHKRSGVGRPAQVAPRALHYKVAELSTVDEHSLESVVNQHARDGWTLDGVQFAMREQSKRPAMAFVFFTREGPPVELDAGRDPESARAHLSRLSDDAPVQQAPVPVSAYERLRQLAEDDDGGGST